MIETPPGQDSHLTRAMKAYHLDKARDPSDLPAWLFDEHERRSVCRSKFRDGHRDDRENENVHRTQSAPRFRGLRDASATNLTPLQAERAPVSDLSGEGTGPVKATNRLKELREAKRKAQTAPTLNRYDDAIDKFNREPRVEDGSSRGVGGTMDLDRRLAPRVGLPSGPSVSGLRSRRH
jgi:hypothetical protein